MKLAVSNIAWKPGDDDAALDVLARRGVHALEAAPGPLLRLERLDHIPADAVAAACARCAARGLTVIAMQALLFGRPDLALFGALETREAMARHLERLIDVAGAVGEGVRLVFGSPRNRLRGALSERQALDIAVPFFHRLGQRAEAAGAVFCIEPNATGYGADFATTTAEALHLVRLVDHPGFGLHVDAGVMTMNGENYTAELEAARPWIRHVHVSEPHLGRITDAVTDHPAMAAALRRVGWDGHVSIEMKSGLGDDDLAVLDACIAYAQEAYLA